MTGVRADNQSSLVLCNKLGVSKTEWICASCIDKEMFGRSSVTNLQFDSSAGDSRGPSDEMGSMRVLRVANWLS